MYFTQTKITFSYRFLCQQKFSVECWFKPKQCNFNIFVYFIRYFDELKLLKKNRQLFFLPQHISHIKSFEVWKLIGSKVSMDIAALDVNYICCHWKLRAALNSTPSCSLKPFVEWSSFVHRFPWVSIQVVRVSIIRHETVLNRRDEVKKRPLTLRKRREEEKKLMTK